MENTVTIITQARMGSTRLPEKIMLKVNNTELLKIHLDRLKKSNRVTQIVVATTTSANDKLIEEKCNVWNIPVIRGSEDNVLDRYYKTANKYPAKWIVRVTSDCPLIDASLLDKVIDFAIENDLDYCSNTLLEKYPDGQDVEVFKKSALDLAWKEAVLASDKEHVTPYIKKNSSFNGGTKFKSNNYDLDKDYNNIRMTVDEPSDFDLIKVLIEKMGVNSTWEAYTQYIIENNLSSINGDIIRNEGYIKSLKDD